LQKDDVPQCSIKAYKVLARKAFDLGYQEIQLQVWGKVCSQCSSLLAAGGINLSDVYTSINSHLEVHTRHAY